MTFLDTLHVIGYSKNTSETFMKNFVDDVLKWTWYLLHAGDKGAGVKNDVFSYLKI